MQQFGPYSTSAHQQVKHLAQKIKLLLPKGKVIAVHNNNAYSLHDYQSGHALANDAKLLYMDPKNFYRNFYLVTQSKEYHRLKKLHFNSVLQAKNATDDGSLSVLFARSNYINVEAGYNQLAMQMKMLRQA